MASRIEAHQSEHGFCFFAAELAGRASFIGFIGLSRVPFAAPFTPAVEIGWRLAPPYWHKGLATEGAQAVLSYAFRKLNLDEVVSFTVPANIRSRRVMEKIGLHLHAVGNAALPVGHADGEQRIGACGRVDFDDDGLVIDQRDRHLRMGTRSLAQDVHDAHEGDVVDRRLHVFMVALVDRGDRLADIAARNLRQHTVALGNGQHYRVHHVVYGFEHLASDTLEVLKPRSFIEPAFPCRFRQPEYFCEDPFPLGENGTFL